MWTAGAVSIHFHFHIRLFFMRARDQIHSGGEYLTQEGKYVAVWTDTSITTHDKIMEMVGKQHLHH